jgi:hypothetical protein
MAQVLLPGEQLGPDGGPGDAGGTGDFEISGAPPRADDLRSQKRRQQDGRARARARNERRAVLHAVQKQARRGPGVGRPGETTHAELDEGQVESCIDRLCVTGQI